MCSSIIVGTINNSIMIGTVNRLLLNVTKDECICEMMKINVFLLSGLNYFSTNGSCELFYSNNNSIIIEYNVNRDFMFINQSAISITNTTETTTTVPTCGPSVCCSATSCSACVYSSTTYYCIRYGSLLGYNFYTNASDCTINSLSPIYCTYDTTCGSGVGHPGLGSGNGC
ncbi:unnamed protein product [Adineta steineri]|uniref:Uncharacterized protein n=1 Tax=Adineta steineri TaxID=433720 RepID=A0A814CGM5_9BILA|nr:unnamed protein product [Adineta steineri]CAF3756514.1 unnamed protein product [Adineta steineri]